MNVLEELDSKEPETAIDEDEGSLASFTRKRGLSGNEPKQSIKLELPEVLSKVIHQGLLTLEERGLKKTAGDFVQSCLESVTEEQVSQWVEKVTPLEWRVNECLKDAEKAKLVKKLFDLDSSKNGQILKALEQVFEKKDKGGRAVVKKKKKPNAPAPDASLGQAAPEASMLS